MLLGTLVLLIAVAPLLGTRASAGVRDLPVEPVIVAMVLALIAGFVFLRRLGTKRIPGLPIEVPAYAFLAFALFTVAFSPSVAKSGLTWMRYAMYCALPLVVGAACVRTGNRRLLSWVFLAAGAVTIPSAVLQLLAPTADSSQFAIPGAAVRVYSFFYNPNLYSEYLIFFISIALALVVTERCRLRWLATGLLACGSILVIFSYTRGTWLGLALGIAVMLCMVDLRALGVSLVAGGGLLALIPGAWERLVSGFSLNSTTESRILLWRLAGNLVAEHPLTGAGLGRYLSAIVETAEAHPSLVSGETTLASHNSYLLLAGETGVIGALLFAWVVLRACRMGLVFMDRAKKNRSTKLEIAAYSVGIIAFAAAAFTDNGFQHPPEAVLFWVLVGMQAGTFFRLRERDPLAATAPEEAGSAGAEKRLRPSPLRILLAPPRTQGRILLGSRLARIAFGPGAQEAPDLAPWDAPLAEAVAR